MKLEYIIIIVLIIFYIWYLNASILEGNWATTPEFAEKSATIYLNIQGKIMSSCRAVFMRDEVAVLDGNMYFVGLNIPLSKSYGFVYNDFNEAFPSILWYSFDPMRGELTLYKDKLYGVFIKA